MLNNSTTSNLSISPSITVLNTFMNMVCSFTSNFQISIVSCLLRKHDETTFKKSFTMVLFSQESFHSVKKKKDKCELKSLIKKNYI